MTTTRSLNAHGSVRDRLMYRSSQEGKGREEEGKRKGRARGDFTSCRPVSDARADHDAMMRQATR